MIDFKGIIGHEQVVDYFQEALRKHQVSHAYIIEGEKGSGRKTIAAAFAKALLCEAGYGDACNMCRSCLQFESGNHPDLRRLVREKPTVIKVDEVREQINADVIIKPYSSRHKVYIIEDAELMNPQAQNALLKTLEEPPAYAVFLLLTTSMDALLPTIVSRCVHLGMRPVPQEKIKNYLIKEYQVPDYQAGVYAACAQGNMGRAVDMACSEIFGEMQDMTLSVLKRVDEMMAYEMVKAIHDLENYKSQISEVLDIMTVWYRDILVLKATGDMNQLVYQNEYRFMRNKAETSSYEGLSIILSMISRTRQRLIGNVNFNAAMETLLLTIKEN